MPADFDISLPYGEILDKHSKGLTNEEAKHFAQLYGKCNIYVQIPSILSIFFFQVLNPFYFIMVFSVTVWFIQDYTWYALAIIIFSLIAITTEII